MDSVQGSPKPVTWWHIHRRLYDWVLHWAHTPYGTPALGVLAFTESSFFPIPPDVLLIALGIAKPRRSFYYAVVCSIFSILGGLFGYLIGFALWNPVGAPILKSLGMLNRNNQPVIVRQVDEGRVTVQAEDGAALQAGRWSQWLKIAQPAPEAGKDAFALHRGLLHADEPMDGTRVGSHAYEREQTGRPLAPGQTAYFMTDTYHQARALYEKYDFWIVFAAAFTPIPYKVFTILSGLMTMQLVPFIIASAVGRSMRFFMVATLIFFFGQPVRSFVDRYFNLLSLAFFVLLIFFFAILSL